MVSRSANPDWLEPMHYPARAIALARYLANTKRRNRILGASYLSHVDPFNGDEDEHEVIDVSSQEKLYNQILAHPLDLIEDSFPLIIAIGSTTDDLLPLAMCGIFATELIAQTDVEKRVYCIDAADPPVLGNKPSAVVIHNLLENATKDRFQQFRDLIYKYKNIPRFLVISSDSHLSIMKDKLRVRPDSSILVESIELPSQVREGSARK